MSHAVRRLVGVTAVILLLALSKLLFAEVSSDEGTFRVLAVLGDAGSGLQEGGDVKMRGVLVGEIIGLSFVDGEARATLQLEERYRIPRDVVIVVTAKTFLGPKQVELRPQGPLEPPLLTPDDVLRVDAADQPVEVQEVLAQLDGLFTDIPAGDLATLVDALGSFDEQDAEVVGRNIDQGAELAAFGARTADEQIARLSALADVVDALAGTVDDFNRLNRSLPRWVSLLPDRQADVRSALDSLSAFSLTLAGFLEVERSTIRRLLVTGDAIGGVIEPRVDEIGRLVFGIYRYSRNFGEHGGSLNDGTEHAWFRAHIGEEGETERFCEHLPPELEQAAPGCVPSGDG
ncbi:MAG: MCE family protein [Actinobacteria bacterium]|nr:MCE family protein [Actinomycetota bacterium]